MALVASSSWMDVTATCYSTALLRTADGPLPPAEAHQQSTPLRLPSSAGCDSTTSLCCPPRKRGRCGCGQQPPDSRCALLHSTRKFHPVCSCRGNATAGAPAVSAAPIARPPRHIRRPHPRQSCCAALRRRRRSGARSGWRTTTGAIMETTCPSRWASSRQGGGLAGGSGMRRMLCGVLAGRRSCGRFRWQGTGPVGGSGVRHMLCGVLVLHARFSPP